MATKTFHGCSKTATLSLSGGSNASTSGLKTRRRLVLQIACTIILSLLYSFPSFVFAQDPSPDFSGLDAPSAIERARAAEKLSDAELLAHYRSILADGSNGSQIVPALSRIQGQKNTDDIALIVKYIGDLDPSVAMAARQALRTYGRDALDAVDKLDAGQVDNNTRKDVIEILLKDHIYKACERDNSINPFHLDFDSRFDELYSVNQEVDALMFRMLRDSMSDIRDDISGNRYNYWYGYSVRTEIPFVDYGGLAVAALAKRKPEQLMREMKELAEVEKSDDYYYYGNNNRSPVTIELASFFAHQGNNALMDKLISEMEAGTRWRQPADILGLQVRVASMQMVGLGEYEAALDRLNEHVKQAGSALSSTVSQAHYLRSRILIHLKEEGAALHALEESMEASNSAMVLTLVDSTFDGLANERRYQTILDYCKLASRRLSESQRPWVASDSSSEDVDDSPEEG